MRRALLFGNSQYDKMNHLPQCEFDAKDLATLLQDEDIGAYDDVIVKHNCYFPEMRNTVWDFFSSLTADDTALFYFSGHGKATAQSLYLFSPTTYYDTLDLDALQVSWIYKRISPEECKCKRILILLDCCDSGNAVKIIGKGEKPVEFENLSEGVWVVTSSSPDEVSGAYDKRLGDTPHSVFTHFLIEGLKSGDADDDNNGLIDAQDLANFLTEKVTLITKGSQTPRKGEFTGLAKGRVAFAYNNRRLSEEIPLWVDAPRSNNPEFVSWLLSEYRIIEKDINLLSKMLPVQRQNRDIFLKALKLLHLARSYGLLHIPSSFGIDAKIRIIEEKLFEERSTSTLSLSPISNQRSNHTPFKLPMLKWCLVTLGEGIHQDVRFHLSKYLVTTKQFNMFIAAPDGYTNEEWWIDTQYESDWYTEQAFDWYMINGHDIELSTSPNDTPYVNVNWYEANAFCLWLTSKFGHIIRLPETYRRTFAVKGSLARDLDEYDMEYPWGNMFEKKHLNWCNIRGSRIQRVTSVRRYENKLDEFGGEYSIFGLTDLVGNAWEWTRELTYDSDQRQLVSTMGGSWKSRPRHVTSTYRRTLHPATRDSDLGFRLALLPNAD